MKRIAGWHACQFALAPWRLIPGPPCGAVAPWRLTSLLMTDYFAVNGRVVPAHEAYLGELPFDPERIIGSLRAMIDDALAVGYRGLRVAGDGEVGGRRVHDQIPRTSPPIRATTVARSESRRRRS